MQNGSKHSGDALHFPDLSEATGDAIGVVLLLSLARISMRIHSDDPTCDRILEGCILHIKKRHQLGEVNFNLMNSWTNPSLTALMRLMIYLREEITESLNDQKCAARLGECIDRLARIHRLYPKHLFDHRTAAGH